MSILVFNYSQQLTGYISQVELMGAKIEALQKVEEKDSPPSQQA
jgi:hypothetical protein